MLNMITQKKSVFFRKLWASLILMTFVSSVALPPAGAQSVLNLPVPGSAVALTPGFSPVLIKGINLYPDQPFKFDFIIDQGDSTLSDEDFKKQSTQLIKYFLASLTIPEDDMWVNLSPYEKNRMVQEDFGKTEMGRDLLAQDYMLKQLTASLMNPEADLGNEFWKRVYQKAQDQYGTKEIPLNTFNKIWIVPEKAVVYESAKGAFITQSHLKVMLEQDYVALHHNRSPEQAKRVEGEVQSPIIKDLLIPEIEKEVNEGKTFANLRQIYNSVILAAWYKQAITQSLLNQVYTNQKKISGVDVKDKNINEKIYTQYVESFKKGVFNLIKEDVDPNTQELIPRKYFSGGANIGEVKKVLERTHDIASLPKIKSGLKEVTADMASSSALDEEFLFSAIFNAPADYWESGNGEKAILDYVQKLKGYLDSTGRTPGDVFRAGIETLITAPISSMAELERLYLIHKEIWENIPQVGFQVLRFAVNHVDNFILTDDRDLAEREINKNWAHTAFDSVYVEQQFAIAEQSMGSQENLANWFAENVDLGDPQNQDFVQYLASYLPDLSNKYFTDIKFSSYIKSVLANAALSMKRATLGYQIARAIHSHFPVSYADFKDLSSRVDQVMASAWQDAAEERTYQQLQVNDIIRVTSEGNKVSYLTVMDMGKGVLYLLYLDGKNEAVMSLFSSNGGTYMRDFDMQTYVQVNKIEVLAPKKELAENPEAFLDAAFKNQTAASSSILDSAQLSKLMFKSDESYWTSGKAETDIQEFAMQLGSKLHRGDTTAEEAFNHYLSKVLYYTINSTRDLEKIFVLHEAIWEYAPEVGLESLKYSAYHIWNYMVEENRRYATGNKNWAHTLFDSVNLEQQFVIAERAMGSADQLADWLVRHVDMTRPRNQWFIETLSMYLPEIFAKYFKGPEFVPHISSDGPYAPMVEKQSTLGYRIAAKVQHILPVPYSGFNESYSAMLKKLDGIWKDSHEVTQLSDLNINDIVRVTYNGGQVMLMIAFDRGPVNVYFLFLDGGNHTTIEPRYEDNQLFMEINNGNQFLKVEKLEVLTPKPEVVADPEAYVNSVLANTTSASSSGISNINAIDDGYFFNAFFHAPDEFWRSNDGETAIQSFVKQLKGDIDSKGRTPQEVFKSRLETLITAPINHLKEMERFYLLYREIWENIPQVGFQILRFSVNHIDINLVSNDRDISTRDVNKNWGHSTFDGVYVEQQFAIAEQALGSEENLAKWFAEYIDLNDSLNKDFVSYVTTYFPDLANKYLTDQKFNNLKESVLENSGFTLKRKTLGYRIARFIHSLLPMDYTQFEKFYDHSLGVMGSLWQVQSQESTYQDLEVGSIIRVTMKGNKIFYLTVMDKGRDGLYLLYLDGRTDAVLAYFKSDEGTGTYLKDWGSVYLKIEKLEVLTPKPEVVANPEAFLNSRLSQSETDESSVSSSSTIKFFAEKLGKTPADLEAMLARGLTYEEAKQFLLTKKELGKKYPQGTWSSEITAKNIILAALDTVDGFTQARKEGNIAKMAELYRTYVIPYRPKDRSKNLYNGQVSFFIDAGRLDGLLRGNINYILVPGSPAELLRIAVPELINPDDPNALREGEIGRFYSRDSDSARIAEQDDGEESVDSFASSSSVQQTLGKSKAEIKEMIERGLTYEEAHSLWVEKSKLKFTLPTGIWKSSETARNFILVALDSIDGFKEARQENNVKKMANLYRDHVKTYKSSDNLNQDGQIAFFIEIGYLKGLMGNKRDYLRKLYSPAELLRLALPGLIDVRNPDALNPLEVERKYWSDPENAKYHILLALDTIDGFTAAYEKGDIKTMADLYRKNVKDYRPQDEARYGQGGQQTFFEEVGGLKGLLGRIQPFTTQVDSPAELLRLAIPELIDDENPDALKESEIRHVNRQGKLAEDSDAAASSAVSIKIKRIQDILGKSAEEVQKMVEQGVNYDDAAKIWAARKAKKFQLPDGFWRSKETAKNFILVALDTIPGFKEEREKGSFEGMADLYRTYVINYETEVSNQENGQFRFFIEVGGLGTLMLNKDNILEEANSPAALLKFAIPGLISNDLFGLSDAEVKARYLKKPKAEDGVQDDKVESAASSSVYEQRLGKSKEEINAMMQRGLSYDEAKAWRNLNINSDFKFPDGIWDSEITAKNFILLALDSIPGFKETRESGNIEEMRKLYQANVIRYMPADWERYQRGGEIIFFKEKGGLAGLMGKKRSYLSSANSPAALVGFAIPELGDVSRQRNKVEKYDEEESEYSNEAGKILDYVRVMGKPYLQIREMIDRGLTYDEAYEWWQKRRETPFRMPRDFWKTKITAKNYILVVLDSIPGFKAARLKNKMWVMAKLYIDYVAGYQREDKERYRFDGQQAFFYEQGGLHGLMITPRPYFRKTDSPAELMRLAIPQLMDQKNPYAIYVPEKTIKSEWLPTGEIGQDRPKVSTSASSPIEKENVGGIDLNSKYLNIEIHRDGKGMPILFTPEELKQIYIPGLVPVISNIQPVTSLEQLLKP